MPTSRFNSQVRSREFMAKAGGAQRLLSYQQAFRDYVSNCASRGNLSPELPTFVSSERLESGEWLLRNGEKLLARVSADGSVATIE